MPDDPNGQAPYCPRCGEPLSEAAVDHRECEAALLLEPPRYCPQCRRRMVVQVEPTHWEARCSRHGEISGTNAPSVRIPGRDDSGPTSSSPDQSRDHGQPATGVHP